MGSGAVFFGAAAADRPTACESAKAALDEARTSLGGASAKLAVTFASCGYPDFEALPGYLRAELPHAKIVGGTAGGAVYGPKGLHRRGVSVALTAGDGLDASLCTVPITSWDVVEAVKASKELAAEADVAAKRGLTELVCLVLAPGLMVDGDALAAAVRKGIGARAQLAGGLTGDDLKFQTSRVLTGDGLLDAGFALVGIFTAAPVGVAARHGAQPIGPSRIITRSDGPFLISLDGRTAIETWTEDARAAGIELPKDPKQLAVALASYCPLGMETPVGAGSDRRTELVVRVPFDIQADGSVRLSAGLPEGSTVRVVRLTHEAMRDAAREAADSALAAVGGESSGALVLGCSGRLAILGDGFADEIALIGRQMRAPVGGACVFGEIARARRDVGAFFNTTTVVVAFPK
jgi:hypothetical protein